jgi:hypothetical protein
VVAGRDADRVHALERGLAGAGLGHGRERLGRGGVRPVRPTRMCERHVTRMVPRRRAHRVRAVLGGGRGDPDEHHGVAGRRDGRRVVDPDPGSDLGRRARVVAGRARARVHPLVRRRAEVRARRGGR